MKPNKAEKFVKAQLKLGKTFNNIRLAIFEKFLTWNFPPEYKDALISTFPNYSYEIKGCDPVNINLVGVGHSTEYDGFSNTVHTLPESERECFICPKGKCECEVVHLDPLPAKPGTQEWENMIDFMRTDIESNMGYSKLINAARKSIEDRGLNFDDEFEKWKRNKGSICCYDCDVKTQRTPNSTGYCENCGSANVKEV